MTSHEYFCELEGGAATKTTPNSSNVFAILRGGGYQASVVYDGIKDMYRFVMVWDDATVESLHPSLKELQRFTPSSQNHIPAHAKEIHCFVAVGSSFDRKKMTESTMDFFSLDRSRNLHFPTLCHKSAVISPSASIGQGCFIGPFALVNAHASIGEFCLVNSSALVEHDCTVGNFASLAPGAILLGGATLETAAYLGANAIIREQRLVSAGVVVGMGAAVTRNVPVTPNSCFWGGVPARPLSRSNAPQQCGKQKDKEASGKIRWCFKKKFSLNRFQHYIQNSVERGHLTNDGPLQEIAQERLRSLIQTKCHVLLCANGTAALHALVSAHALKRGGKPLRWVTQAFTFPSSIQGPLADSLVCDIDLKMRGPSLQYLNGHRGDFDGIIVTNVFGFQADILGYEKWCKINGKLLVFDNAASPIGFVEDNRCIHDVGDGAIISLHETKPFGRGEGGAVVVAEEISPYVHQAMNFGYDIPNQVRIPNRLSSNWRMSDFAAAAICDHLDTIAEEAWVHRLKDLGEFAEAKLGSIGLCLALEPKYPTVLSCLLVKINSNDHMQQHDAERVCRELNCRGIEAKHYYAPLCQRSDAPLSWAFFDSTICLPFHLQMTKKDVERMVQQLQAVMLECQSVSDKN